MINVYAEIEGVDELVAAVDRGQEDLRRKLADDNYESAREGIEAAQARHPYTDRTRVLSFTAHPEHEQGSGDAFMFWPAEYGSYVDEGTSRNKAYPFTPMAEYAAESVLNKKVETDVDDFCRTIEGQG